MNYKEAKKIQSAIYDLDSLNKNSTFVAAVEQHSYNNEYSVYVYGRQRTLDGTMRAARIALAIVDTSDTLVMRVSEYNASTTIEEMVTAWEIW